jgi:hypothetical protein
MPFLSKSKIMAGLQRPKRLYLEVHHPELLDYSDETQRLFSIGHEVGEAARTVRPGGKLIEHQGNLNGPCPARGYRAFAHKRRVHRIPQGIP